VIRAAGLWEVVRAARIAYTQAARYRSRAGEILDQIVDTPLADNASELRKLVALGELQPILSQVARVIEAAASASRTASSTKELWKKRRSGRWCRCGKRR
jgi:hypothetical protein